MKKLVLFLLLLTSCALMFGCAEIIKETCTPNAAYNAGVNDAQNGRDMQQNYAIICPKGERPRLNRTYRQGYKYGQRNPKPRPPHHPHRHHHRYYR